MATREQIQNEYIDYVLTSGQRPSSVYIFSKNRGMDESEFYEFFGSFEGVEESIWTSLIEHTIDEIKTQDIWNEYSSREKALSFFYSYTELLKSRRSFILQSYRAIPRGVTTPAVLEGTKETFKIFASELINDGLESGELAERKFFDKRYKDALWAQFAFILNFWIHDGSPGFEKTDEAIEKGINLTFDMFERSAIDNLIDYGKFLARSGGLRNTVRV
ncbi:TetR/AcrR family transcriptional regulator [Pedobacter sp. HMF7647]|uniref:TetR/AcrR family transcriptional regulator n=2 Tax=Hufsiella arboris TaxID=2695275 RepID=A0A7K1YED5_9SPHI|nr:TetR/AcrR family transcriptional regulator [Hufsiella arboris]